MLKGTSKSVNTRDFTVNQQSILAETEETMEFLLILLAMLCLTGCLILKHAKVNEPEVKKDQ